MSLYTKKSQITIFLIAGLVIFATAFLTIYLTTSVTPDFDSRIVTRTPTSFSDYIDVCIEETASQGIMNLGFQGGYMELPSYIRRDDDAFISFGSRREFGIPLWHYKGDNRIPDINDMEKELSAYVEDNVHACLDDFSGYHEYNVTERAPINVSSTITLDDVSIDADYPVDVLAEGASQTEFYEDFFVTIPVMLGRMHELASRITYSEVWNNNFEMSLIDLMVANPNIPITEQSFSTSPLRWNLEDIAHEIDLMSFYNFQNVRFQGTDHPDFQEPIEDYEKFGGYDARDLIEDDLPSSAPEDAYEYFNLFFDPNDLPDGMDVDEDVSFSDIATAVKYYPSQNLDVHADPSSRGVLSTSMTNIPGTEIPFPIQLGHFTYDVDFPLEISLIDDGAFSDQRDFVFRFGLPVVVRSNEPDKEADSFTLSSAPVQFEDQCEDLEGEYEISVRGLHGGFDNVALHNADISYDCLQFGCHLGSTRAEGNTYRLTTGLPSSCTGGFLNVEKEGYVPERVQHTGDEQVTINLNKIDTYDVRINRRLSNNLGLTQPLEEGQSVVANIEPHDYDDIVGFEYSPGDEMPEVDLLADGGEYTIELFLMDDEHDFIIGGYKGNFSYDYMDAAGRNAIEFSAVQMQPLPVPFDATNQVEVMDFIERGDYIDEAAPVFR